MLLALKEVLRLAHSKGINKLQIFSDSKLIVDWISKKGPRRTSSIFWPFSLTSATNIFTVKGTQGLILSLKGDYN